MSREKNPGEFRRVLSPEETGLPALSAFGYAEGSHAPLPVLEHRHRDKLEFLVCAAGMLQNTASDMPFTLYPGEAIIIHPDELHACLERQPAAGKVFWFQIELTPRADFLGLGGDGELLRGILAAYRGRRVEVREEVLCSLGRAFQLLCDGSPLERLRGRIAFLEGLLELLAAPPQTQAVTPDIDRAKQYIYQHVREPIDVDELLLQSGLPLAEFRRKFESQLGCKLRDYINRVKVEHARVELADGRRSVTDVAYRYHFPTAGVLRAQFKRTMGVSIPQYRRQARRGAKNADDAAGGRILKGKPRKGNRI